MIRVQVVHSILELEPAEWRPLADPDFPFTDYHFLHALETTDCLGARTGWQPRIVLARAEGKLIGALILFAKTNSYGEYIFDFAWAQAYAQAGLAYYPKLTSAIPFTPATGAKMLLHAEAGPETRAALFQGAEALATALEVSSQHALFVREDEIAAYLEAGYFLRHSYQFHWRNQGYKSFADFLGALRAKRRKEIARERAQVKASGITIRRLTGEAIQPAHAEVFHQFYLNTIDKRQGFDYLTAGFFKTVFATMPEKLLLVLAVDRENRPVAGALNYLGARTLFGRNWGCLEEHRALHFELCYYQGLELAIEKGLQKFEAGAQGEHKFQRGFGPELTYSLHKIRHPALARAITRHVEREKAEIQEILADYRAHSPYHRQE